MSTETATLPPGLEGEAYRAHVRKLARNQRPGGLPGRPARPSHAGPGGLPRLGSGDASRRPRRHHLARRIRRPRPQPARTPHRQPGDRRLALPESVNSLGKELAGPIILAIGTEEQKQRYLRPLLEMREIWCQGFSEPNAGSDLAGLRTRAVRDGAIWRVTGRKIWTSGSPNARRCLLLARTGPLEDRHKGLALFAMSMDMPGVSVHPIRQLDGKDSFAEVLMDNVEIPAEDALGSPDEGWGSAVRVLSIERATNRMYRAWRFENELAHSSRPAASMPR